MSEARWSRAAGVAGVVVLALWIIALVLLVLDHQLAPGNVMTGAGFLVFAGVGIVVALQLKWLACGAAVTLGVGVDVSSVAPGILSWIFGAALFALPVSIGVGILRYRLYDIDRIISRTLAYAIVTALLVGVYTGLVLMTTHLLTVSSSAAVAASTLAAAALFNPLRRRVQRAVDRRFNRARYDADQTLAGFATRLNDAVDLDSVRDDLAAVVQQTLEPAHLSVWISRRGPGVS